MNNHSVAGGAGLCKRLIGFAGMVLVGIGCTLPLSTAAPQAATTVGQGGWGGAVSAEIPAIDLLATSEDQISEDEELATTISAASLELSYGLTDRIDIEASLEGALLFFIPIPVGASLGARFGLVNNRWVAVSLAARAGRMRLGRGTDDNDEVRNDYTAVHGQLSAAVQLRPRRRFRPGLALSVLPVRIKETGERNRIDNALAVSATANFTFVLGPVHLGPYFNTAYYTSSALEENHLVYSLGFLFAARPR